jgi:hypothetical protein
VSKMNKAVLATLSHAVRQAMVAAAHQSPRCMHLKANGARCGSPALRDNPFCYFHDRCYNPPYEDEFPVLEDAASIQVALMQVLSGLRRGKLDPRCANSLFYGLQTAAANVRHARFRDYSRDLPVTEEALGVRRKPPSSEPTELAP